MEKEPTMISKMHTWLRARPLASYFILAYLISWGIEIPVALSVRGLLGAGVPTSLHYLAGYGPMLAAIFITGLTQGKSGLQDLLRRMAKWRVRPVWWLVALAPLGVFLLAGIFQWGQLYGRLNQTGSNGDMLRWVSQNLWQATLNLGQIDFLPGVGLAALPLWLLTFGIGEETGWRGYALPRLQENRGPLSASLILWVLWALWHLPLFFYSYEPSIIPGFLVGLLAGAITFTWLYNGSGGSILIAATFHAFFNFVTACAACQTGVSAAVVSAAVMVWAVLLAIYYLRSGQRVSKRALQSSSR
jgi:membrane protease YdiL (CAAX protease family)